LRFKPIREFKLAVDFSTIKTDKHTGEAIERQAGLVYRRRGWLLGRVTNSSLVGQEGDERLRGTESIAPSGAILNVLVEIQKEAILRLPPIAEITPKSVIVYPAEDLPPRSAEPQKWAGHGSDELAPATLTQGVSQQITNASRN